MANMLSAQIDSGMGYMGPSERIQIPPPPVMGATTTHNYISISESTIGVLNTGTIRNLNNGIGLLETQGLGQIAAAIKEFTEAADRSTEIADTAKKEIIEQLDVLVAHLTASPQERSTGLIKSILGGVRDSVCTAAALIALWDKLIPLVQSYIG